MQIHRSHIDISFTFALNQVLTSTNAMQVHHTENINAIYSLWCNYYWKENYFLDNLNSDKVQIQRKRLYNRQAETDLKSTLYNLTLEGATHAYQAKYGCWTE